MIYLYIYETMLKYQNIVLGLCAKQIPKIVTLLTAQIPNTFSFYT